jgi:glycosyltransferase involved in cell wall biosynthesis
MAVKPTVSVIIPAYNVAPYIIETLDSLLEQTYTDYEAIVVNDGSTDDTEQAIAPYLEHFDGKLIYIRQENRGLPGARNTGMRQARGRYIFLLDGDDTWLPDCLATMVALVEADPTIDVLYPNAIFDGSPNFSGRLFQEVFPACEPVTFEKVLKRECYVFSQALFKRELLERVGEYDESLRAAEDFDLWLRMLHVGCRFAFTRQPLIKYRWRSDSLSNTSEKMVKNLNAVYRKWLNDPAITAEQRELIGVQMRDADAMLNWSLYRGKLRAREFEAAAHHLALANAHYRKFKLSLVQVGLRVAPKLVAKLIIRQERA